MNFVDENSKWGKLSKAFFVDGNSKWAELAKAFFVDENSKWAELWSSSSPRFVQVTRNVNVYPYGGLIRHSQDGKSWTSLDMQLGNASDNYLYYNNVVFGNGVYVASFYGGYLAYSTDGISWTKYTAPQQTSNGSDNTTRVYFCNGKFILYIYESAPYVEGTFVYTSTNGINWTYVGKHGSFNGSNYRIDSLAYGKLSAGSGNVYIAILSYRDYGNIWYSTDLLTWTRWYTNVCGYGMHMKPNCDYPFFVARLSGSSVISNYYYNTQYSSWSYGYFDDRGYSASVYNEADGTIYFYSGTSGGYLWKWSIATAVDGGYYSTTQGSWIASTGMPINAVHGNGLFVGYNTSSMVYSTDGQTWTVATSAVSETDNTQICFGS